ncbi:MAG: SDR family NAD(P)-dependent oxidoreductase [Acidimicrobiales bacterium]|nr:SDR family NAD(P)-dependent oxidoreductase [Acidimicrobiales bacterium]
MKLGPEHVAVIVGGGGGVGRGTALGLASRGVRCVIADIEIDTASAVADEVAGLGVEAVAAPVDATDAASLAALADEAERRFGGIHILSNNVGVVQIGGLLDASEAEWGWVIEFNLMTIVRSCATIVPRIRAHGGGGHVVNTASMAGLWASRPEEVSGALLGLYTTTKHAVVGYTDTLRGELAAEGIGVSCLCPGTVDSNLMATSMRNRPERFGGPEEFPESKGQMPHAMAQEDVGRYVVAGIEADRGTVLTHPRAWRFVENRAETLAADFEFFAALQTEEDA